MACVQRTGHGASSGSLFRGGKSPIPPPPPSPSPRSGVAHSLSARLNLPRQPPPRRLHGHQQRDLIGRGTSRRRLDKQRGWLSKFQISPHRGFDPRRTRAFTDFTRAVSLFLRSTKDLSIPCLATSSFQSFYIYYNSLVM